MYRLIITITISFFVTNFLTAQTAYDALRYSQIDVSGTARTIGVGGAIGAFGADYSVLSTNPAGLGAYRRSEFVVTPSLWLSKIDSRLTDGEGNSIYEEYESSLNFSNLGLVIVSRPRSKSWRNINLGIGFNRVANFNQTFFYRGQSIGSITDRWVEQANAYDGLDSFESGVAVAGEAVYDLDDDGFYETDYQLSPDASILREQTVLTTGSMNELVFSLGGNFEDKLMVGATIGVPFLTFTEEKNYFEQDTGEGPGGDVPFFNDLRYRENLTTTGIGVNLKLGLIYRVHQMFRLGLAMHTPTALSLEDNYSTSLGYNFTVPDDDDYSGSSDSPDGIFEYKLYTPWKIIGSAGVLIDKSGFVSGEIEYVDYSAASFNYKSTDYYEDERMVNDSISTLFGSAINARFGGEFAYKNFRLRGGVNFQQSPYENDDSFNNSFSLGVGIREEKFFLDFAYKRRNIEEGYVPYLTAQAPMQLIENNINNNEYVLTFGYKF